MTGKLPEPTWGTTPITRDTTIPGTYHVHVIGDETFVEITDDPHDGLTRPLTPVDIVVSEEAVDAAKLHVEASQSAGIEPDPVVALMAQAQDLPEDMETWAKDQAIEAALSNTDQQAALMTAEGGLTDQTGEHDTSLRGLEIDYHQRLFEILGEESLVEASGPKIWPEDEDDIIKHAMAILPHIGAEATVAYLTGALARISA